MEPQVKAELERLDELLAAKGGGGGGNMGPSMIVWAPFLVNPAPPVYSDIFQIANIVNQHQGACRLIVDTTGGGFAHMPSTASLDGKGRLEIVGGGPNGEAEIVMDDGAQIKNVREWRTIVIRGAPTIRPPILYDLDGLVVEAFDATFIVTSPAATLPIIEVGVPSYLALLFYVTSELRNGAAPANAVLNLAPNITLLWVINNLDFASSFDNTVSGPVTAAIQLQIDASLPAPPTVWPAFLGTVTPVQIDSAFGVAYTPAVPANWAPPAPTNVQQALDRLAAAVQGLLGGPIP